MNQINIENIKVNQRDIEKGQKIIAAIYLVTNHLSDNEPLRKELRSLSVALTSASFLEQPSLLSRIEMCLGACALTGLISEKNSSIIVYEAKQFVQNAHEIKSPIEDIFDENIDHQKQQFAIKNKYLLKDIKKTKELTKGTVLDKITSALENKRTQESKISRQEKILYFINDKKSAVIKDITTLFPEVSEKTIQRELGVLVEAGRIIKRGNKRWSIYMAVNSLL